MGVRIVYNLFETPRHRAASLDAIVVTGFVPETTLPPTMSTAPDATTAPPPTSLALTPQLMVIQCNGRPVPKFHNASYSDEAEARKSLQGRGGAAAATDATVTGHPSIAVAQRGPEAHHWN